MKFNLYVRMLLAGVLMSLYALPASAQTSAITGTVYESDGKTPLIGAAVVVKSTTNGVTTGADGKYSIRAAEGDVLQFSSLGFNTREVPVGTQSVIDVTMTEAAEEIGEVVVTALGLSREAKSLGYAVTKIDGDDVLAAGSSNWLDALNGQVAGLTFDQASPGPMSSMRVVLRGDQSLNYGNNQALFVIDGVPISNAATETASGSIYSNSDSPVDFGNGAADLNPDDIESISVLKGPAATALYGSRAANGAIVITTKKGRTDRGIGITYSSVTTFEQGMRWPDFQKEYGPGSDNGAKEYSYWTVDASESTVGRAATANWSRYGFGEKFDPNETRYIYASRDFETGEYTPLPWVYADNWFTGLFQTGVTTKNTVTLDASNGTTSSMRLSVSDTRSKWILPNTPSNSQTVSLSSSHKLNKAVTISGNVNYIRRKSDNVPNTGYGVRNPVYQLIWSQSVNDMNDTYKREYFEGRYNAQNVADRKLVYAAASPYNPYRTLYEEVNTYDKHRVYGHVKTNIDFGKGIDLDLRAGLDLSDDFTTSQAPYNSGAYTYGFYKEQSSRQYEYNLDFLLRYQREDLDGRFTSSFGFGGNHMRSHFARNRVTLDRLEVEGVYNINNAAKGNHPTVNARRTDKSVNSLYGYAQFGWDNFIFVDVTGRNDWTSTLGPGNWSFFYPSVSASFLIDEVANFRYNAPWINMLKLRGSWANVGNDTNPYMLESYYASTAYSGGYLLPTVVTDPNIKPENVESWEVGLETRFLNNSIAFDAAFYRSSTTNQIVSVNQDAMTAAQTRIINAGEVMNKGVELNATFTPVRNKNGFNWTFSVNWSKNWNKLVSLTDDWDPASPYQTDMTTTIGSRVYIYSYVGEAMGYIYGKDYQRAPEGSYYTDANGRQVDCSGMILINQKTGQPILDDSPTSRIAKVNPDWNAGMSQNFRYKNWSLSMNFAAQWGGHCFSATHFALAYQGKLKNSLEGRYDGLIVDGVYLDDNGGFKKNDVVTNNIQDYYNTYKYNRDNVYENTFKTSYLKLKKLSIDYSFPAELCRKSGFIEGASIGIFATNVFCLTSFPLFDPETGNMTGTNIYRGIETGAMPMVRQYGFNLKLSF